MAAEGIVKKWDDHSGYGFLQQTDPADAEDVFVGRAQLQPSGSRLVEGASVRFDPTPSDKKPGTMCAKNVTGPGVVSVASGSAENPASQICGLQQGIVVKWDEEKSYGFLKPIVGGEDVYIRQDSFDGPGILLEGLMVWFQAAPDPVAKKVGQLQARHVTGPGVVQRADVFQPGDIVVHREGIEVSCKDQDGKAGGWTLGPTEGATVVRTTSDDGLILDNGEADSEAQHAAFWWKKTFIRIGIEAKALSVRSLESTLGIRLRGLKLETVELDGPGRQQGLREGMHLRWVGDCNVYDDRTLTEALQSISGLYELTFLQGEQDTRRRPQQPVGTGSKPWEIMYNNAKLARAAKEATRPDREPRDKDRSKADARRRGGSRERRRDDGDRRRRSGSRGRRRERSRDR